MKIHLKLRKLRKERKWSQADLATKLGIHTTHVSRIEAASGKYLPSVELLKKIVRVFNVSADYFLDDDLEDYKVKVKNKSLADKVNLIDSLEEEDQKALIRMIDCMLTQKRMLTLLSSQGGMK